MSSFFFWLSTMLGALLGVFGIRTEEQPTYQVTLRDGAIEVREYQPYVIASVTMQGSDAQSRGDAFRALAGYIFGDNQRRNSMKMTAPVLQAPATKMAMTAPVLQTRGEVRVMSFVMPAKYKLEELPLPNNPQIRLAQQPAELVAVIRFSGAYSEESFERSAQQLLQWIQSRTDLEALGEPRWAAYDPPFALPFTRRNEVIIPIRARKKLD